MKAIHEGKIARTLARRTVCMMATVLASASRSIAMRETSAMPPATQESRPVMRSQPKNAWKMNPATSVLTVSMASSSRSGFIMWGMLRTSRMVTDMPMNAPEIPCEIILMDAGMTAKPVTALMMPTASMLPIMAGTGMPTRRPIRNPPTANSRVTTMCRSSTGLAILDR